MDENRDPSFVINSGTVLGANSYLVLCNDESLFLTQFQDVINFQGNLNNGLSGNGESIFLYDNFGKIVDSLTYNDKLPWSVEADGAGSSLELKNPSFDNAIGGNWSASINHGTPGKINSTYITTVRNNSERITITDYLLNQNYPNPFNPVTNIKFAIPELSKVELFIYDILGRQISTLANKNFETGIYSFEWDGGKYSSGIYFVKFYAESLTRSKKFNSIKKIILMK
jgi:hypothetical protein